jgi:hypothetical protein
MQATWIWALAALAAALAGPAQAADVGVSIGISQPGVYGRIDIGRFPQPELIVRQPVIIDRSYLPAPEPIYLWVPPGHQRHWREHCRQYKACGRPVYFVQDGWYRERGPGREQWHGRDDRQGDSHDGPRGGRRDDRRDDDRQDDHGRGHGHGHGKGRD